MNVRAPNAASRSGTLRPLLCQRSSEPALDRAILLYFTIDRRRKKKPALGALNWHLRVSLKYGVDYQTALR